MKQNKDREELLGAIARGWCYPKNGNKTMDSDLALAIYEEVNKWIETYTQKKVEEEREKCKQTMANSNEWWNNKLRQQREEIIKEIEGIVGEDETPKGMNGPFGGLQDQMAIRNQLRKQIKERLFLIKKDR